MYENKKRKVFRMLIGYMRVFSESDRQNTSLQRDALLQEGVDSRHIFEDKASGAKDKRPGLEQALNIRLAKIITLLLF